MERAPLLIQIGDRIINANRICFAQRHSDELVDVILAAPPEHAVERFVGNEALEFWLALSSATTNT